MARGSDNLNTGQVWTVSELNREVRDLLERGFGTVWIEAEVSNLAWPASGHLYFSLKDPSAQLRCAFFRQRQRGSVRELANGDQVLVRGRLSLYEPRGDYQLIVEHLEPAGEGALRKQFELLKRKLAAEGLFAPERKQPIPTLPRRIGVITSASGAAVRDVLKVLRRRMPSVPVRIFPASVQGAAAPAELVTALQRANRRADCDVLLLVRGGGSMEDLAAFNDEALARAIAASDIPVVSGIGHETDSAIADFVADRTAPTPSAAAEITVPDGTTILRGLRNAQWRLGRTQQRQLQDLSQQLDYLARRLKVSGPDARLRQQRAQLVQLQRRLQQSLVGQLRATRHALSLSKTRMQAYSPQAQLKNRSEKLVRLASHLKSAQRRLLKNRSLRLTAVVSHLNAVSPLATLDRGYAIVMDQDDNVAHSAAQLQGKKKAVIRMRDGEVATEIREVRLRSDD